MESFSTEIAVFIQQNSSAKLLINPDAFPFSPFTFLYLSDKQTVIHCIDLERQAKDGDFFKNLTLQFAESGIKIVHLWEDLWLTRKVVIQSRLLSILSQSATIPARLCLSRRIDKATLDGFLNEHHLQISTSAKFKYGLFLPKRYFRVIDTEKNMFSRILLKNSDVTEEILVAVASFSTARTFVREGVSYRSFELIRFANLNGFTVVGGFDKLLQTFIKEQKPDDIMTYADADWSVGASYEKLGFERLQLLPPKAFELDQNLNRLWNPKVGNNSRKVWNAGSWKYLLKLKEPVNEQ